MLLPLVLMSGKKAGQQHPGRATIPGIPADAVKPYSRQRLACEVESGNRGASAVATVKILGTGWSIGIKRATG